MSRTIAVSFDYRCPFARNAPRGRRRRIPRRASTWTSASWRSRSTRCTSRRASRRYGIATPTASGAAASALEWGIAVRDPFPDHFLDAHIALFAARHDQGLKLKDEDVLREAATGVGLDPDAVAAEVAAAGR